MQKRFWHGLPKSLVFDLTIMFVVGACVVALYRLDLRDRYDPVLTEKQQVAQAERFGCTNRYAKWKEKIGDVVVAQSDFNKFVFDCTYQNGIESATIPIPFAPTATRSSADVAVQNKSDTFYLPREDVMCDRANLTPECTPFSWTHRQPKGPAE